MCFVPFVNYWRSAPIWAWPLLVAGLPLQPLLTAYHSAQKLQGCAAQIAKNYPPQFFVICLALQFAGRYVTGVSPLAQPHARIMAQPCALIRWYISGQSGAKPAGGRQSLGCAAAQGPRAPEAAGGLCAAGYIALAPTPPINGWGRDRALSRSLADITALRPGYVSRRGAPLVGVRGH